MASKRKGQRADGRYEVKYTLPNGKRASAYGPTLGEARGKRDRALENARRGIDGKAGRQRLADYLESWYADIVTPKNRPKTLRLYRSCLDVHIIPALGHIRLGELAPSDVQRFLNQKSKTKLSPRSVNNLRDILRAALSQAVRWGYVERNAAALANPVREVRKQITPLSAEQAQALIAHAWDDVHGPLIVCALATGLRQGELLGLRWHDIKDGKLIRVQHAIQKVRNAEGGAWEWRFVEPKSERGRRPVPLIPQARRALDEQKRRNAAMRELAGVRWQEWELVFPSIVGTPQDGPNVTKRLQRILQAAGLPRQRFHDLRHGTATHLGSQGVPLRVIQEILGHSQISLTADTYSHVLPAQLQAAAEALERALSSKVSSKTARPRIVRPRSRQNPRRYR